MTDDITIKFIADVSDLQKGMQQATGAVEATTGSLRNGAAQISTSFSSLSQAYAGNAAQKVAIEQTAGDAVLASARRVQQEQYAAALEGATQRSALIKEQAQLESVVNDDVSADYRRSFEQVGSSFSSSVMSMIRGHETLGKEAQKAALSIVQSFVQARVKMAADWAAGLVTQIAQTTTSEAAKTEAVAAGTTARTSLEATASAASAAETLGAVFKSISASAAETFAGIFGFLSPVMGPAAAGPAAAGEAAVIGAASGLASFAVGAWSLPSDMIAQVHQGEMIVPAGPAAAFRSMMEGNSGVAGTVHVHHATNFNVQAIDAAGVKQFFKDHGKTVLRSINESVRTGSHLGLSKLGSA